MRRSCAPRSTPHALGSLVAAAALGVLAACAGGPSRESNADTNDPAGARAETSDLDAAASNLAAAFNRRPDPAASARAGGPASAKSKLDVPAKRPASTDAKVYPEPTSPATLASAPMPVNLEELAARRDELVLATARTLRAWADAGGDPTVAATQQAALAAFPTARPGALPSNWLDSDQHRSVDAISGLMHDLAAQGTRGLDSATAGALLSQRAAELGASGAVSSSGAVVQSGPSPSTSLLSLPTVALCRKVDSFGVYEPLASTTLQVGRAHSMIIYTEVDGFEQHQASTADHEPGFSSELSQTVMLYHDADGLLAWSRPEVTVHDATRRQRRDHFIVQRLDLPASLTIGKYNLKILVRDKLTGAEAESTIPISVVASTVPADADSR
jgi:hypothetical protein